MIPIRVLFSIGLTIFGALSCPGQIHLFPEDGEKGVPGPVPKSFVVGWQHYEGATGYQYVISDNPLCFSGCAGDTREGFVTDSFVVQFNMEPNHWYYWVTRIFLADGDTSQWTLISSFFTEGPEDLPQIVSLAPNPVTDNLLRLRVDWGLNPDAQKIKLGLYDQHGGPVLDALISKGSFLLRFEDVEIPVEGVPSGLYYLHALVDDNLNNSNNTFTLKVLVVKN